LINKYNIGDCSNNKPNNKNPPKNVLKKIIIMCTPRNFKLLIPSTVDPSMWIGACSLSATTMFHECNSMVLPLCLKHQFKSKCLPKFEFDVFK
jgi:hypothetical protein